MKKNLGAIISILVGLLTFGMYFLPFYGGNTVIGSYSQDMAYKFIFNETLSNFEIASLTAFSVFSVILLTLAGCLIVCGIFLILQNQKIIKSKSISKLNNVLLILTSVAAIGALICYFVFYTENIKISTRAAKTTVGATTIVIAAVAIVLTIVSLLASKITKSKKKSAKK